MAHNTIAKLMLLLFSQMLLPPVSTFAQYQTTYARGVTDITGYIKSGTNGWKLLAGGGTCLNGQVAVAYDGNLWCPGTDHYAYKFNVSTQTWTKQTAMGAHVLALVVQNDSAVWSFQDNQTCSGGYKILKWTGSAWTQPNSTGCLGQLAVGRDGTLAGVSGQTSWWSFRWRRHLESRF